LKAGDPVYSMDTKDPRPTAPKEAKGFEYKQPDPWRTDASSRVFRFVITAAGNVTHTITFDHPATPAEAISAAERYLSEPVTRSYYGRIRDDLYTHWDSWEDAREDLRTRGNALGDSVFAERIVAAADNAHELLTGS